MEAKETSIVTGGAGFIGSHLCDALLARGHAVICIDNLLTGSEDNIREAKKSNHFTFIKHDVTLPLPALSGVHYIFHLASPASVIDYQKFSEETALVNSTGTIQMLRVAHDNHARFLFASTSEVYGDPKEHPQKETYWGNVNPNGIRSCYDESKRFGEAATMLFIRKYDIDARIVRIFNTYGPRMRKTDGRVISNFVNQALAGAPITVYGDGRQTRSFCYVSDLVDVMIHAMTKKETKGEVINIGNPEEYTMIDLANNIKKLTQSSSEIVHAPLPVDDPQKRRPDITKATTLLGWTPKVRVSEGLQLTIDHYKEISK